MHMDTEAQTIALLQNALFQFPTFQTTVSQFLTIFSTIVFLYGENFEAGHFRHPCY